MAFLNVSSSEKKGGKIIITRERFSMTLSTVTFYGITVQAEGKMIR